MNDEHFKISAYLKNIIGKELITDEFVAVFELVKNSFDANATEVKIIFKNQNNSELAKLIIVDNGKGMNYDELKNKWLFVAYSYQTAIKFINILTKAIHFISCL
jgi:HSP90 family molecular chaperone